MSNVALAVAGAIVFALTTWASLAFGYQIFANLSADDQATDGAPGPPLVASGEHDTPAAIPST